MARIREPDQTARKPRDVVHVDLAGPVDAPDINGMKYSLVCIDSYTNFTSVSFIKQKSDTPKAFKQYLSDIAPYGNVKTVRSDQGGEFVSEEFASILIENKLSTRRQ
ncbi:CCHC-type zinc finger, nucleic acid binding protein a [Elysia marginata]|uniref:CCHC-type zinc finger, nucleic acid binding protein a n=1 Tax=Elysia marginata TaxID=1093978 RepID=A0AAV4IX62_9GAST|nr:CCHC-type zinc finger, nucleic acid binding protein a [Elysia marginata]